MNQRTKVVVCASIAAVLIIAALWWLWPKRPSAEPSGLASLPPVSAAPLPLSPKAPSVPTPASKNLQIERSKFGALATLSAAPIEFYGKVIDQDGKPLPGVDVIGGTGSTTGFMQQETRTYTITTNEEGLFSFSGFRGDALIVDLKKPGYNFKSDRVRFHYSPIDPEGKRFNPERKNPVLFQIWKSLGAEPMIHYYGRSVRVPADGTVVRVDLAKGRKVESDGDLLVSAKWGPREGPEDMAFDWSVKIEGVEGGLIEGDGSMQFIAPADGYQPSLDYSFFNDKEGRFTKAYYIRTQGGRNYGRVELSIDRQEGDFETRVGLSVWLNPSGSRNLEYDPSKQASAR